MEGETRGPERPLFTRKDVLQSGRPKPNLGDFMTRPVDRSMLSHVEASVFYDSMFPYKAGQPSSSPIDTSRSAPTIPVISSSSAAAAPTTLPPRPIPTDVDDLKDMFEYNATDVAGMEDLTVSGDFGELSAVFAKDVGSFEKFDLGDFNLEAIDDFNLPLNFESVPIIPFGSVCNVAWP